VGRKQYRYTRIAINDPEVAKAFRELKRRLGYTRNDLILRELIEAYNKCRGV